MIGKERTVRVADLKARLSEYLRAVRLGHPVTVCDRDTPVARLVPYPTAGDSLSVRGPTRELHEIVLPAPGIRRTNSLEILMEERQSER